MTVKFFNKYIYAIILALFYTVSTMAQPPLPFLQQEKPYRSGNDYTVEENNSKTTQKLYPLQENSVYPQPQNKVNINYYQSKNYPVKPLYPQEKISYIEKKYNKRLINNNIFIKQFGYDFFHGKVSQFFTVDDNYVLGPGDELYLYVIGGNSDIIPEGSLNLVVDREGQIYIPNFGVFYVWGLTLKKAESLLSDSLGINVKLSLGKLRNFPVYISGEVNRPGAVIVSKTNTIIDAIILAGGISKTGSLRDVVLTRRDGEKIHIDFYQILLEGKPINIKLRDGDVIFVKPIGKTVAIVGEVKKPAIYEIKGNETVRDIIKMSGGLLASSYKYKVIVQRYKNNELIEIKEGKLDDISFLNQRVKDGDIVIIREVIEEPKNAILLQGEINYPGYYEYKDNLRLSEILKPDLIKENTDIYYAKIERLNPITQKIEKVIKFAPVDIIEGKKDIYLRPNDRITFYPKYLFEPIRIYGEIKKERIIPYKPGLKLLDVLADLQYKENVKNLKLKIFRREGRVSSYGENKGIVANIGYGKNKGMITNVGERRNPQQLNQISNVEKNKILKIEKRETSNRLSPFLSVDMVDLILLPESKYNITLEPGDEIFIDKKEKNEVAEKVYIFGYVKKPGVYEINEKTTLYDVLKKAGGFRENANPKGILLLRNSLKKAQQEKLQKSITLMKMELEKEKAGIMQAELSESELRGRKEAFKAKEKLLDEMLKSQVVGRISGLNISFNLEELKNSPSNILLENGDKIYVPKKPSSVMIFGEVYNPSAYLYIKDMKVKDYIRISGGLTKDADIENIFIIKANGIAISGNNNDGDGGLIRWSSKQKRFVWGGMEYSDIMDYRLEPGDAIIVPTKVRVPTMWRPLIRDIIQMIYQGALAVYVVKHL